MEFWGVEVKAGDHIKVEVDKSKLHTLSQVSIGKVKNGEKVENFQCWVKYKDEMLEVANLSFPCATQAIIDRAFAHNFEVSHGWEEGSVYFLGYTEEYPPGEAMVE